MAVNSEILLISSMLRTGDYLTPISDGVTASLFHTYQDEWTFLERYIGKHRRVPSRRAFKSKFPETTIYKVDDVAHFTDEVKESHTRFELVELGSQIAHGIKQGDDPTAVLRKLHGDVISVQSQLDGESETYEVQGSWQETYVMIRDRVARVKEEGHAGISTGYESLDLATGGIFPGHYWVLAGRLGHGKSWTMIRIGVEAMLTGKRVQYFSLESSRHQVAMRVHTFLSSMAGKEVFRNLDLVKGENFDILKYKRFLKNLDLEGKFYINDQSRGSVSPLTIAATIEKNQPDIVFVDYLTLMERDSGGDDWQSVAKVSESVQRIAQRYNVPVVVASQINRAGGGGGKEPPGTEHISRSDSIGQDADAVVTIKQMSAHTARMRLAKYRHGRDGQVFWCAFKPNTGELEEITGDDAHDIMDQDIEDAEE